jgi:hypothetical protein
MRPSATSSRVVEPENGTTTRFRFGARPLRPARVSRVTIRRALGAGSRTRGMLCWLEPAKPLSTSTAVFIAVRMTALRITGYSTLVYRIQSHSYLLRQAYGAAGSLRKPTDAEPILIGRRRTRRAYGFLLTFSSPAPVLSHGALVPHRFEMAPNPMWCTRRYHFSKTRHQTPQNRRL